MSGEGSTGKDTATIAETILYVKSPKDSAALYGKAFGMTQTYLHPDNWYASMKAGGSAAAIAFASQGWATSTHGEGALRFASRSEKPAGIEVCLGPPGGDVDASFDRAIKAGFKAFKKPFNTMWGSRMAYMLDIDGHIISFSGKAKEEGESAAPKAAAKGGKSAKGKAGAGEEKAKAMPTKKGVKAARPAATPSAKKPKSAAAKRDAKGTAAGKTAAGKKK